MTINPHETHSLKCLNVRTHLRKNSNSIGRSDIGEVTMQKKNSRIRKKKKCDTVNSDIGKSQRNTYTIRFATKKRPPELKMILSDAP